MGLKKQWLMFFLMYTSSPPVILLIVYKYNWNKVQVMDTTINRGVG